MLCPAVMSFFNVSDSFYLVFIFFYFFSILLARFFHFLCRDRSIKSTDDEGQDDYLDEEEEEEEEDDDDDEEEEEEVEEEEEEEEEEEKHVFEKEKQVFFTVEYTERDDLVADIICGGEALLFLPIKTNQKDKISPEEDMESEDCVFEDPDESFGEELPNSNPPASKSECNAEVVIEEKLPTRDTDSIDGSTMEFPTPMETDPNENGSVADDSAYEEGYDKTEAEAEVDNGNVETNFSEDENFLIFGPTQLDTKKLQAKAEDNCGDSFTVGSTSKSSSEWRSSMICRDSGTEDPFSSSSRRSCPNWESYTVFRKYDEEMMFLDRISAQKLNETESLRGIEVFPRSISQRIVHKLTNKNRRSKEFTRNPYYELENAYAAQICVAWEALNWNYKNFQRLRASQAKEEDPGCPGRIAQQFQQFQVLLQRYIENEPYECGRRPEIYARMRICAPKLLQVPEFRDSEEEQKEEGFGTRISSYKFLKIMEEGIETFMNFLKADKEKPCQVITRFFRRHKSKSVDPTHLHMVKKANRKKKMKLKDLRRGHKCIRRKKLKPEEDMEILMGLIDLKVVSRVLRMSEISEEQLRWCEEKMSKVRLWEGKLQRDSSPLFFPNH